MAPLLSLWILLSSASAQEAPADADPPAPVSLDRALATLAEGSLREGCDQLRAVDRAGGVDALRATQIARVVHGLQPTVCRWVGDSTEIATDGRAELLVSQSVVWPAWFATAGPIYFQEGSAAAVGGLMLGGLAVGLGGTWLATQDRPVSTGQALMVYTGEILGGWYGLWLEAASRPRDGQVTGRPAHLGVLVGAGAGIGLAAAFPEASAGDVALVRSGAVWGTGLGGLATVLWSPDEPQTPFLILGLGTTAGVGITSALTVPLELRRGQVNTINLAGYAGALTGGALALIAQTEEQPTASLIGAGSVIGLGIGAAVTTAQGSSDGQARRSREGLPEARFTVVTDAEGQAHPGLIVSGSW